MITYWPNRQSIDLNLAVSNLFTQTYQKFFFSFANRTSYYLPIDILSQYTKRQLLLEILAELEILIVDIIEVNLGVKELKEINSQILLHLINTTTKRILNLQTQEANFSISFNLEYNKLFFHEHSCAMETLLAYLIFGSGSIIGQVFPFNNSKTPFYHVKALFENIILQAGSIIAFNIVENAQSIQQIYFLIYNKSTSTYSCQSIRKISNFKNNLISNNLINTYVHYPQNIYCGRYPILLLSSKGMIRKCIYLNRYHEYLKLSSYQLISVVYLEAQDFIAPRLNQFIILAGRLIIYVFIEIIGKNFNIILKHITEKFNTRKY
jgi:hypothetical protein